MSKSKGDRYYQSQESEKDNYKKRPKHKKMEPYKRTKVWELKDIVYQLIYNILMEGIRQSPTISNKMIINFNC